MKNIIITGSTSGIGFETALDLALRGLKIGITWRNNEKGLAVLQQLRHKSGNENITGYFCDFSSFESVRKCSENIKSDFPVIDVLINNAGTWETKFSETSDGIEQMFMVNFLAPVYFSKLLHPQLKASGIARVVMVSSAAHMMGKINKDDPESRKKFKHIKAYSNSKLNILLATKLLANKWANDNIKVNALHPGVVNTRLFDKFPGFLKGLTKLITISPEKGAQTSIYLATEPEGGIVSGKYFAKRKQKKASANAEKAENLIWIDELLKRYLSKI
ncbi:3alpha-hydroxy bile acid-CoA-ester 3-dehydrogenase 2 [bioreactor metagenome]|uniref:3alpha-hydroxy bile acid-CoA-ester 3-dehydrogenase 2 n=1 Tax=bioreactor metagenome TaxID=1076179 RepID=A0A644XQ98_9ZZZZ